MERTLRESLPQRHGNDDKKGTLASPIPSEFCICLLPICIEVKRGSRERWQGQEWLLRTEHCIHFVKCVILTCTQQKWFPPMSKSSYKRRWLVQWQRTGKSEIRVIFQRPLFPISLPLNAQQHTHTHPSLVIRILIACQLPVNTDQEVGTPKTVLKCDL